MQAIEKLTGYGLAVGLLRIEFEAPADTSSVCFDKPGACRQQHCLTPPSHPAAQKEHNSRVHLGAVARW